MGHVSKKLHVNLSVLTRSLHLAIFRSYDMGISRLVCRKDEEFRWLFPELAMEGVVDTPIFACKFAQVKGEQNLFESFYFN